MPLQPEKDQKTKERERLTEAVEAQVPDDNDGFFRRIDGHLNVVHSKFSSFATDFKGFLFKSSLLQLAIGVILGGALTAVVTSLSNDILMPPISLALGEVNLVNHFAILRAPPGLNATAIADLHTPQMAVDAGAVVMAYGRFF